ncbi:hypothetical protein COJ48_25575 [Bacillus cereus]|nr:hypothetical protein CN285_10020 [Bacillus cereus]PFM59501.1 hypothetical protein COJ48_25575 [Bacillus cereus]PGM66178.1 hypothetical protein CN947_03380 [Bacillus cereus]PGP89019.1 hypothetical protein CN997_01800 [Bacillus cereus]
MHLRRAFTLQLTESPHMPKDFLHKQWVPFLMQKGQKQKQLDIVRIVKEVKRQQAALILTRKENIRFL